MNLFQKQPADQLDYDLDFSDWLTGSDSITGVVATVNEQEVPSEDDLIVVSAGVHEQIAKIWLGKGVSGVTYKITATVTTNEGRIKQLEFKVKVRDL